jgi:hypothetical protein
LVRFFLYFGNLIINAEKETLEGVAQVESHLCEKNEDIRSSISEAEAILAWHHLSYTKYLLLPPILTTQEKSSKPLKNAN